MAIKQTYSALDGTQTFLQSDGTVTVLQPEAKIALQKSYGGPIQVSGPLTINATNGTLYNQAVLEFTTATTITISAGLTASIPGFTILCIPPASGNASIVSDGTVLLNGATTTVTRTAGNNSAFSLIARGSAQNSFIVTGA